MAGGGGGVDRLEWFASAPVLLLEVSYVEPGRQRRRLGREDDVIAGMARSRQQPGDLCRRKYDVIQEIKGNISLSKIF